MSHVFSEMANDSSCGCDSRREELFLKIVATPTAFFKSQQRREPDLTDQEKLDIVRQTFTSNPRLFMARYSQFLETQEELSCCNISESSCNSFTEVALYLDAARSRIQKTKRTPSKKLVQNRRYAALRKFIRKGDYFSDAEMRSRAPVLYNEMVGQYLTPDEREALFNCGAQSTKLSDIFMAFSDDLHIMERGRRDALEEETEDLQLGSQEEEEEEMEEEEEEDMGEEAPSAQQISREEKQQQREEFVALMHERFLNGADADFDYAIVDANPDFDPLDLISQDAEDAYFDSEQPD